MSPFAGEGANLAMYDGAELARALVATSDDIEAALATHENDLFPKRRSGRDETGAELLIADDTAPQSVVASIQKVSCENRDTVMGNIQRGAAKVD